jgi:hypothetical protein
LQGFASDFENSSLTGQSTVHATYGTAVILQISEIAGKKLTEKTKRKLWLFIRADTVFTVSDALIPLLLIIDVSSSTLIP